MALVSPLSAVLAYSVVCGTRTTVDETTVLDAAWAQTRNELLLDPPIDILPPVNDDAFLIYAHPDDFGGLTAVSARTGLVTAGIRLTYIGDVGIAYPTRLHSPTALSRSCANPEPPASIRGYDTGGATTPMQAEKQRRGVEAVWRTSLPAALARSVGPLRNVLVFSYPYELDTGTVEAVVVLIDAGEP